MSTFLKFYSHRSSVTGRILNRFSKDMGAIDELLPAAMIDCLQVIQFLVEISSHSWNANCLITKSCIKIH